MNRQTQASGNFAFHCYCHCSLHCPRFMCLFCIVTDICFAKVIPELPSTSFIFLLFFFLHRLKHTLKHITLSFLNIPLMLAVHQETCMCVCLCMLMSNLYVPSELANKYGRLYSTQKPFGLFIYWNIVAILWIPVQSACMYMHIL